MEHERQHYVNGARVDPLQPTLSGVVDPSPEETFTHIAVGGTTNVNREDAAAKAAFVPLATPPLHSATTNSPATATSTANGRWTNSPRSRR
jgi:acyl-CoA reductase-like NAD-dependent aldehyde dehydrogenase